jgi:peptidoglycan-associated lipoprotein
MKKRMSAVLIAFVFVCSSLLLSSCAKKQIQVSDTVSPPAAEQKVDDAAKAKMEEEARKRAEEEAAKQARQRELEKRKAFAAQFRMFESQHIYFAFDKSDLTAESQALLKQKDNWLRDNASYSIRIDGHCDERGTNEYNLALGERRAHAAKKFLMDLGISGDRISTLSYGEERPADPGHNEQAWSKNRRDEFKLIK